MDAARSDADAYDRLVRILFPALFCANQNAALDVAKALYREDRDAALGRTVDLVINKRLGTDPRDNDESARKNNHDEILDALRLISEMVVDSTIHHALDTVATAICAKCNRQSFTGNQKTDYAQKIRAIYAAKLPDAENIKHEGYVILCEVIAARLEDAQWPVFEALQTRTSAISNQADRAYI